MEIYCKLDNLQRTGSFKERGARNALVQLSDEQKNKGARLSRAIVGRAGHRGDAQVRAAYQNK
jgi:threonine dehydratase